ncbi:MAG TPA: phospholipase D-like domain-containing protein [Burkholderiales bacterium]|nr:phospholipase D-like domain-containing protein [Burkholderiales bacterium]
MVLVTLLVTALVLAIAANLATTEKRLLYRPRRLYTSGDADFRRALGILLGPPLLPGNRITSLVNGEQIYAAMLNAIRTAHTNITFETFVFRDGVGATLVEELAAAARRGVQVHMLLNWLGSRTMNPDLLAAARAAGCELHLYHPPSWYHLGRLNNRTHRKLLVVDGRIGFTGGVGIADKWAGDAQDADHWRDTHYRVEGPAVAEMQAAFMDNWTKTTGEVLHSADYFPAIAPAGGQYAQVFQSSVEGGSESMHLMYLLSVAAASRSIQLSMAYFDPDAISMRALKAALARGVKIQILLPGPITDAELVQSASRATWGELIRAGAEIYQYQPTMFHCKVMVVDGLWTSVGSTNFDNRSFRLNDEANLNVYDAGVAAEQAAVFAADLKHARRLSYEEWQGRPWREKLAERLAGLLNSQL